MDVRAGMILRRRMPRAPGSGEFIATIRLEPGVVYEMKYGDRIN